MKNISIKWKLISLIVTIILTMATILVIFAIYDVNKTSEKDIKLFEEKAYQAKKDELKSNVDIVLKTIESFYDRTSKEKVKEEVKDKLTTQASMLENILISYYAQNKNSKTIKQELINIVKNSKYGKNGYFWINDQQPKMIMHPFKPALDGRDLSNSKDPNGKKLFVEMVSVSKAKSKGFVDYQWPKPGFDKPQDKVSYIFTFKPFGWIIGTGEYIDNVNKQMQNEALNTISQMRYGNAEPKNYFWINDKEPKMVMHPIKPSLNGKSLVNSKDPNGKKLFVEMVEVINKQNSGYVDYQWPKPGFDEPQNKISYVAYFPQWNWIIGTGVYIDDIEKEVNTMKSMAKETTMELLMIFVVATIILLIIILFILYFGIMKSVVTPIESLKSGFNKLMTSNDITIRLNVNSNDEIGQASNMFNKYMDSIQEGLDQDQKLIDEAKGVINRVKNGWYSETITAQTNNPSLKEFTAGVNEMIGATKEHFSNMNLVLEKYAAYDYREKLDISGIEKGGVFETLVNDINKLRDSIVEMLVENKTNGLTLDASSNILLENVDKLNKNSNDAATRLEETSAALEQITGNIRNNTENVVQMANYANEVTSSANEGEKLANQTTVSMDEINSQVSSINEAITVIDQIAFQTNILSLNAAVEAATAGEAGKGFAVVAQEVRNLASRSAEAAKEIKDLVENATAKANEGKLIADKMISGYNGLNDNISKTISLIKDVEGASKEQQSGIVQINDAINSLDQQTQQNAMIANQTYEVAIKTDEIAKLVVSKADEKEFEGKDSLKAESLNIGSKVKIQEVNTPELKETKTITSTKKESIIEKKQEVKRQEVISSNTSDDEWESF